MPGSRLSIRLFRLIGQPEATNIITPGETPSVHETDEGEAAYEPGEEDGVTIPYLALTLLLITAAIIFVIYAILRSYKG